jgi:GNAT superfamily N-acetyltransferase
MVQARASAQATAQAAAPAATQAADRVDAGARAGAGAGAYVEVLTCAVRRGQQRRGVGTVLAHWVLSLAHAHGVTAVLVAASDEAAPFWRRVGFGTPPEETPREWIEKLRAQFEHSSVRTAARSDTARTRASVSGFCARSPRRVAAACGRSATCRRASQVLHLSLAADGDEADVRLAAAIAGLRAGGTKRPRPLGTSSAAVSMAIKKQ